MRNKKTLVMSAWALVAVVFLLLLALVWFNNSGLNVEITPTGGLDSFAILVSNQSNHIIRQISVVQEEGEKKEIGTIASLRPRESREFLIPVQESRITIEVKAPFHIPAEKSVFIPKPEPFTVEAQAPERMVLETEFEIRVQVCNNSDETRIEVSETHDPSFFGSDFQTQTLTIPKGECQNRAFRFLPAFSGPTLVIFNAKSTTLSTRIEKELVIGT